MFNLIECEFSPEQGEGDHNCVELGGGRQGQDEAKFLF